MRVFDQIFHGAFLQLQICYIQCEDMFLFFKLHLQSKMLCLLSPSSTQGMENWILSEEYKDLNLF